MKTDEQIITIATTVLLHYFTECEAENAVQKLHCMQCLNKAMKPFATLCSEHSKGRDSQNSILARQALNKINKTLFPITVNDQPKKH